MSLIRKPELYTSFTYNANDSESISGDQVQSVCQDAEGTLWIATKWSGANSMNLQTKKFIRYVHDDNDPGSLSINLTLSVLCERSGTIWITSYYGLNKLNRYSSRSSDILKSGKIPIMIRYELMWIILIKSNDDKIWVETGTGWELFDPNANTFTYKSFEPYNLRAEDRRGNLWFTKNSGGIYRKERNGNITRFYDISGKEFQQHVNCVFISPNEDEAVWLGTIEDGIFLLDQQNTTVTLMLSAGTSIKTIYQDTFGMLWAGTKDGGLLQFDPAEKKKIRYISDVNDTTSISGNNIITIFEDKKGNIWLGTNVGLNRYDREKDFFIHYTEMDGLPSNFIMAIEEDSHGNLMA